MVHQLIIDDKFDPEAALTPQIYRILKERIIKNNLRPGTPLSEPEIAKAYNVSRQPVRESFIKLAEEGLLIIRPQRRTLVTKIDFRTVVQARFVREAVEADIVMQLAREGDLGLIRELRHQLQNQNRIAETSRLEFIDEDMRFHRTLAEAAGKSLAWDFIEKLNSQMDRVRFLSLGQFPADQLVNEHTQITDQIERQDTQKANEAIRSHLQRLTRDLPEIIRKFPDFFDHFDSEMIEPNTTHGGENGVSL